MRRAALIVSLLAVFVLTAAVAGASLAGGGTAEPSAWARAIAWVLARQRDFHRELSSALQALAAGGGPAAGGSLVLAGFLYGVFHAAGPGHGKAVIATYLLTNKERRARGIALAAAAAVCQGVVAVALVYGLIYGAGWLPRDTAGAVAWSERMSFALVTGMGAFLIVRAVRGGLATVRRNALPEPEHEPEHEPEEHGHHHHDHTADACGCGHAHGPSVDQIDRARDLRTSLGVVLSIGLRPCSGAVLVLVLAKVSGLAWAGIAAVAAMSAGTALAVSGLAVLAVNTRAWAVALAARRGGRGAMVLGDALTGVGGALILAIGVSLLTASFGPAHPLGLR